MAESTGWILSHCLPYFRAVAAGYEKLEQSGVKAGRLKNERARAERENAAAPGAAARGEDNALSVKVTDETRACV